MRSPVENGSLGSRRSLPHFAEQQMQVRRRGNCHDNAVIESFFSSLKRIRRRTYNHARKPGRTCSITSRCYTTLRASTSGTEDYPAQHPSIINSRLGATLRKSGSSRGICSSVSQYRSLTSSLLAKPESDPASHIHGSCPWRLLRRIMRTRLHSLPYARKLHSNPHIRHGRTS